MVFLATNAADVSSSSTRRITLLYITALIIVAALAVAGHLLMRNELDNQAGDSRVVNIAGRQRMLSQRLCKVAMQLHAATMDAGAHKLRAELSELLSLWEVSHRALRHGDDKMGVPGTNSPAVTRMLDAIEPHFQAMRQSAKQLLSQSFLAGSDVSTAALQTIMANEQGFLSGMDEIVFQYDREAADRVYRLKEIERSLMLLTLLVLTLEGTFVFRPAVRRIRSTLQRLEQKSEEARVAQESAEFANQVKSRFLAHMSHEIRTPMNAVLGLNDLVLETELTDQQRHHLTTAKQAAESLLHLINSTLDYAKLEAGNLQLDERPFALRQWLADSLRPFESLASQNQLALIKTVERDLPDHLIGDPDRLRQIVTNLVGNAVKFTSRGQVAVFLKGLPEPSGTAVRVQFVVQDTGIGIAKERLRQIFEPFSQAESSITHRYGGTGLGLSIATELVERMQGDISVESALGRGSTFVFSVLLRRAFLPDEIEPVARFEDRLTGNNDLTSNVFDGRASPQPVATGLRILVVDDNAANQLVAAAALQRALHVVTTAADGRSAIQQFSDASFDVVLLDVQLPDLNGFEVADALRRIEKKRPGTRPTPLIAVTAYAGPDDRKRCLLAGMNDYLTKPIRPAQLLTMVHRWAAIEAACEISESSIELAPGSDHVMTNLDDVTLDSLPADFREAFERLEFNAGLWSQLTELLALQAPELLQSLDDALAQSDWQLVELSAHRLAGLVGNLTTGEPLQAAKALEDAAISRKPFAARRGFERIQLAIDQLIRQLDTVEIATTIQR